MMLTENRNELMMKSKKQIFSMYLVSRKTWNISGAYKFKIEKYVNKDGICQIYMSTLF